MSKKADYEQRVDAQSHELKANPHIIERAKKIKLLMMDVDGVMTDGKLFYFPGPDGKIVETKGFHSHDGVGLHLCHQLGIVTGIISGRSSPGVDERARMLNMKYVYQGHLEKIPLWDEVLKDAGLAPEQAAYIGDDFTDVPLIKRAGLGVATANARDEVKQVAHLVTLTPGGQGAVREVIELILKSQGLWDKVIHKYFG
ncbi:MAG TPA: HAD hydrolase family protein [Candidatus Obscuribacterales bacterium]